MDALELQQEFNFAQMLQGENATGHAAGKVKPSNLLVRQWVSFYMV